MVTAKVIRIKSSTICDSCRLRPSVLVGTIVPVPAVERVPTVRYIASRRDRDCEKFAVVPTLQYAAEKTPVISEKHCASKNIIHAIVPLPLSIAIIIKASIIIK